METPKNEDTNMQQKRDLKSKNEDTEWQEMKTPKSPK